MKRVYPVIFTQTQNGFLIEVPDLEILTEGTDMENAIDMARDAMDGAGNMAKDAADGINKATEDMTGNRRK